jgi:uncharacterized repeat protein (TIGR03837 family)
MTSIIHSRPQTCDIFCAVVDNYGDIGVSWRLARQLAHEHGIQVRLWVDDLHSFVKLCAEADEARDEQSCRGVQLRRWHQEFSEVVPAELVIEAFACKLPPSYIEAMAAQEHKPVWINLEYLSAEDWVEGAHMLPSPHSRLPLVKYFFFPGFTEKTGGLLLERDLLLRRDAFQADLAAQQIFWHNLGVADRVEGELRVSLFSYENESVLNLLQVWVQGGPVLCCLPEGRVLAQVASFFGQDAAQAGDVWQRGNLRVHVLPFVDQECYDELLWACDINFVRGEDSCVRAQWAGKPCVWHIYPQHDGVHMKKLRALSGLYGGNLSGQAHLANEDMWLAWNGEGDIASTWQAYTLQRVELSFHARAWADKLAGNNLALNLLDFFSQVGRIRAFKI